VASITIALFALARSNRAAKSAVASPTNDQSVRSEPLVLERHDLALVGAPAGDAHRRAIERREKGRARHVGADLVEHRLEAEIDPGRRSGVVIGLNSSMNGYV
jgi:hypothetical protein